MTVADFEASAVASAEAMVDPRLCVGTRIYRAVRQSRAVTGCNTNLGIVLLCAPLAEAALHGRGRELQRRLIRVLRKLDRKDASYAFRAICLSHPGGLGDAPRHDVRRPARVTLLTAMVHARRRDAIARQYASGYSAIFRIGIPCLQQASMRWGEGTWAVSATYLSFLAALSDSHVRRKFGLHKARTLSTCAGVLHRRLMRAADPSTLESALLRFDAELKAEEINPGTSADLTVATLFAAALQRGLRAAKESSRRL
jgi:triphosphoribosyl-dephospho-CoA synthase